MSGARGGGEQAEDDHNTMDATAECRVPAIGTSAVGLRWYARAPGFAAIGQAERDRLRTSQGRIVREGCHLYRRTCADSRYSAAVGYELDGLGEGMSNQLMRGEGLARVVPNRGRPHSRSGRPPTSCLTILVLTPSPRPTSRTLLASQASGHGTTPRVGTAITPNSSDRAAALSAGTSCVRMSCHSWRRRAQRTLSSVSRSPAPRVGRPSGPPEM